MKVIPILVALALPLTASAEPTRMTKAVQFDYCSTHIHWKPRQDLAAFAKAWRDTHAHITIEGNALAVDEETSIALGQKRADAVKAFLVHHGVDASYVTAVGDSRGEPGRYVDLVIEAFAE